MWRASVYAAGGLFSVFAAVNAFSFASSPAKSPQSEESLSFEQRWLQVGAQKADRLDASNRDASTKQAQDEVLFLVVPRAQTTVALKQTARPAARNILIQRRDGERRDGGKRTAPPRPDSIGSEMPEGCESSFSPVTVPAMAHVSARCVS